MQYGQERDVQRETERVRWQSQHRRSCGFSRIAVGVVAIEKKVGRPIHLFPLFFPVPDRDISGGRSKPRALIWPPENHLGNFPSCCWVRCDDASRASFRLSIVAVFNSLATSHQPLMKSFQHLTGLDKKICQLSLYLCFYLWNALPAEHFPPIQSTCARQ